MFSSENSLIYMGWTPADSAAFCRIQLKAIQKSLWPLSSFESRLTMGGYRQFCQRFPKLRLYFRRIRLQRSYFQSHSAVQYVGNREKDVRKYENESFDPLPIGPVQASVDERPERTFCTRNR